MTQLYFTSSPKTLTSSGSIKCNLRCEERRVLLSGAIAHEAALAPKSTFLHNKARQKKKKQTKENQKMGVKVLGIKSDPSVVL